MDKGFLIFYDWMPALEGLTPKDFKTLMTAIWRYQEFGTPPPEFSNKIKTISLFIFPQIDRRKQSSRYGKKSAEMRRSKGKKASEESEEVGKEVGKEVGNNLGNGPISTFMRGLQAQDVDEDETKTETKTESETKTAPSAGATAAVGVTASAEADARATEKEGAAASEETEESACGAPLGRGYGKRGNVYLSTEEYLALRRKIKHADAYIDHFSEKLHTKGYRYASHFDAICQWWERDRKFGGNGISPVTEPEIEDGGSFDTDEFFAAAVKRSLGEGALTQNELAGGTPPESGSE